MAATEDAGGAVPARLNWLFDVVEVLDPVVGWRSYTNAEVGLAVGASEDAIALARAGGQVSHDLLKAMAHFFGIAPAFFGDDPIEVAHAHEKVLTHAVRDCGLRSFRICRGSAPSAESSSSGELDANPRSRTPREVEPDGHSSGGDGADGRFWSSFLTGTVDVAQMQALCQNLVTVLRMRAPFDPVELCRRLGTYRGRRIKVRGVDLGTTTSVGHVAQQRQVDSILYEKAAPSPQRDLVIFHEVIHLVREHLDVGESMTCGVVASPAAGIRNSYADWREWEAEVGARMLAMMSRRRPRPNDLPADTGTAERSIASAFGFVDLGQPRP
ncbi:hypothetical protein [Saccharopolyspora sp. NPDC002376]